MFYAHFIEGKKFELKVQLPELANELAAIDPSGHGRVDGRYFLA